MDKNTRSEDNQSRRTSSDPSYLSGNDRENEVSKDGNDNAHPSVKIGIFSGVKSSGELYRKKLTLNRNSHQKSQSGLWGKVEGLTSSFFKSFQRKPEPKNNKKKVSWTEGEPETKYHKSQHVSFKKTSFQIEMSPPMKPQIKSPDPIEPQFEIHANDEEMVEAEGATQRIFRHTNQINQQVENDNGLRQSPPIRGVSSMTNLSELRTRKLDDLSGMSEMTFYSDMKMSLRNETDLTSSVSTESILGTTPVASEEPPFMQLNHQCNQEENKDQSLCGGNKQVQERNNDDDDEIIEDEPKYVHPRIEDLVLPTPEEVAKTLPKELHHLIAKRYKKDCRTWLWKSSAQRNTVIEKQSGGRNPT